MVYHARGTEPQPFAGRALLVFDDSTWHEELTNDWLRKTGFILHSEQMEVDTPVGKGHIDGILTDPLGVDRNYEHKAINHFTFERIWRGDWPLDYFTQVALYISGLQKIDPSITDGVLLIKNKNTSQYIDFTVIYDAATDTLTVKDGERSDGERIDIGFVMERVTQSAVEKFDAVDRHVKNGTLPDRPFELGTEFPCGYCRWGKACWESYGQEFAELATAQELPEEIADKVRFRQELGAQKREIEKQYDDLSVSIKDTLRAYGARQGRAGEYLVEWRLLDVKRVNADKLPKLVRAQATEVSQQERLYVKKLTEEKAA